MYAQEDYLQLSGLQHFAFCRRRWALIHIENMWAENIHTTEGVIFHQRAHDEKQRELRGDVLTLRGLTVFSSSLGLSGKCDIIEFHSTPSGVPLSNEEGLWLPYPIEYKKGSPSVGDEYKIQLCAQAMCLEEMLCCSIPEGSLYYGETHRRTRVPLDEPLRQQVRDLSEEMHRLYARGHTPRVKPTKACNACSLKDLCLPALLRKKPVAEYLAQAMEGSP